MTSDVIRRRYMSYNPLFHNCLHGHNFAKSEPIDGLQHLLTDSSTPLTSRSNPPEVDSLFKRTEQVVFLYDRKFSAIQNQLALPHGQGIFLQSREILRRKQYNPKAEKHGEKTARRTGKNQRLIGGLQVQFPSERAGKKQI